MRQFAHGLTLILVFVVSGLALAASNLRFPDPVVPLPKIKVDQNEAPQEARLYMSRYMRAYIDQFLLLNSLKENLFNESEILLTVNRDIDRMKPEQFRDPKYIEQSRLRFRKILADNAERLYGKLVPAPGRFAGGSRIDAIDRRVMEMNASFSRIDSLIKEVESLHQRVAAVEQNTAGIAKTPALAPSPNSSKLTLAALFLAGISLFLHFMARR